MMFNVETPSAPAYEPAKAHFGKTFKHSRQLLCCRFSPCGKFIFAGGVDFIIQRWSLETEEKTSLTSHTSWVSDLVFHPDGKRLFSVDYHANLLCWNALDEKPQPVWSVKEAHKGCLRGLAISPEGKWLLTAGDDSIVRMWSSDDGKLVHEFGGHRGTVFSVAVHPDGKSFVSGDQFGTIRQGDLSEKKWVRELDAKPLHTRGDPFEYIADVGGVRALAFDAAGKSLAASGMVEIKGNTFCPGTPAAFVFDWATGARKTQLRVKEKADGYINSLRFLPDGLLAGCGEHSAGGTAVWVWNVTQPDPVAAVTGVTSGYDLDLHPDGRSLAVAQFETLGPVGNGRRGKKEDYIPHGGSIRLCHLYANPLPAKKK